MSKAFALHSVCALALCTSCSYMSCTVTCGYCERQRTQLPVHIILYFNGCLEWPLQLYSACYGGHLELCFLLQQDCYSSRAKGLTQLLREHCRQQCAMQLRQISVPSDQAGWTLRNTCRRMWLRCRLLDHVQCSYACLKVFAILLVG